MTSIRHTFTKAGRKKGARITLRRFFAFCIRYFRGDRSRGSAKKPKSQLSNAEFHLTAGEMNRIVEAAASLRDRVLLGLLTETGLRRCEIVRIEIPDIRWKERQVIIRHGKGDKLRIVPLGTGLIQKLNALTEGRRDGHVFLSRAGKPLSNRQVNRIVAEAGHSAKVSNPNPRYGNITPHLFRHSFARLWKNKGGDIEALAKLLGHSSTRLTLDMYGTLSFNDVQKEFRRIIKENTPNQVNDESDESPFIGKE